MKARYQRLRGQGLSAPRAAVRTVCDVLFSQPPRQVGFMHLFWDLDAMEQQRTEAARPHEPAGSSRILD